MKRQARLSAGERETLEEIMEERHPDGPIGASVTRLHGFFTSVVTGPVVMPSEWIATVFGDPGDSEWKSMDEARRAMDLLMRFYNEVAFDLQSDPETFGIIIDRIGDEPDAFDLADDWCRGYLVGVELRPDEWLRARDDSAIRDHFVSIEAVADRSKSGLDPFAKPDEYRAVLDLLPNAAVEIYDWWRANFDAAMPQPRAGETVRRASPKISANAPCPCGSGKKYKRCCSPLRAV